MMSFYPRSFYSPVSAEASFVPLFRLLDDFDSYARQVEAAQAARSCAQRCQRPRQPRAQRPTFNPRFDVRETEDSYELHGELAGLERENVNVEFTDRDTLIIRGRVERSYGEEAEKTPEAAVEAAPAAAVEAAPSESSETPTTEPEKRRHSHQATVEDDPEDENTPSSSRAASPKLEVAKAAPETQEVAKPAPAEVQPQQQQQQRRFRRWERSVGEFQRAFTFPAPIDHEAVTATMNNGILSVTVPKATKPVARRIEISF
ncbi:30 kDa heat shock protein [Staphylotrichum tortipilum]|uniref:30 kDa heat shock protein n=1 Tax=Staphylotrichum tortipilum TaxID=2831512 RepID=A0AAN6MJW1_9PEZI|nr:30 kDa heat shock protein [Staphylotrichum longicolle]